MIISYWGCDYAEYDEMWGMEADGTEELVRMYACTHPNSESRSCYHLSNKWNNSKDDCTLLDIKIET